jgi:hypothetical protein
VQWERAFVELIAIKALFSADRKVVLDARLIDAQLWRPVGVWYEIPRFNLYRAVYDVFFTGTFGTGRFDTGDADISVFLADGGRLGAKSAGAGKRPENARDIVREIPAYGGRCGWDSPFRQSQDVLAASVRRSAFLWTKNNLL